MLWFILAYLYQLSCNNVIIPLTHTLKFISSFFSFVLNSLIRQRNIIRSCWHQILFSCLVCFAGIDFKIKTVELGGKKIKLQIWWVHDTTSKFDLNKVIIKLYSCICMPINNSFVQYSRSSMITPMRMHFILQLKLNTTLLIELLRLHFYMDLLKYTRS